MGNILKMDLSPQRRLKGLEDEDIGHWIAVQDDFRAKYGSDEHAASLAIGREIGLPDTVIEMMDNMRFSRTEWILREATPEMRIAKYADLRVAPYGITSLEERLAEARERYRDKKFDASSEGYSHEKLAAIEDMCRELGRMVLASAGMEESATTDATAAPVIEELKKLEIS